MTKYEKSFIEKVLRYRYSIVAIIITILAVLVRFWGRNCLTGDMKFCILPWYDSFKANGLSGLEHQVGDYNLLYQSVLALMAKMSYNPMYMVKIFSSFFDFVLACLFVCIVKRLFDIKDKNILLIAYASVLMLPTIILNSAYWGQVDAMYTVFVLAALALLYERKYLLAFIFLGIALGCKLQAVFILPFIAMLYLNRKDFSLGYGIYAIMSFWALGLLAFINGRSLSAPIDIYLYQIDEYPKMVFNFPIFWNLFQNDYLYFGKIAIITTVTIIIFGIVSLYSRKDFEKKFFVFAAWIVWTAVLFLPKMHERYGFLLDILLLLLCFQEKKTIKYAIVTICISLFTYGIYFGGLNGFSWHKYPDVKILMTLAGTIYFVAYYHFSRYLVFNTNNGAGS